MKGNWLFEEEGRRTSATKRIISLTMEARKMKRTREMMVMTISL